MRINSLERVRVTFRNENDEGILEDMTYLPTAVLYVDGSLDSNIVITVTRLGVGTYRADWTMGNYSTNDVWELVVTGWYDGIEYSRIVKEGYIDNSNFQGISKFTRLEAFLNEQTIISFYVGNYDLDERTLRMQVGEGQDNESPPLGNTVYSFINSEISRSDNLATITIPTIITGTIGTYPFSLQDVSTGNAELISGVINVVYRN